MVLESLGKSGSSIAAIMREKDALTDPQQQVKRIDRFGPLHLRQGPVGAGQQGASISRTRTTCRGPATRGAVVSFAGTKIPGVDRIELVWISDPQTRDVGADQRRDRLLREPQHRLPADPGEGQGREADEDRQDRQHAGHDPPQSPASAVRQREGAAGDVLPDQPGGLPARHRRRPEILPRLPRPADLRRSATRTTAAPALHEGIQSRRRRCSS